MISIYWLIAFVVLIGIELLTMALTTIWFAGGAVVGFVLSLCGLSVEVQLTAFVAVSFLLLFLTRPLVARRINKGTVKTNVESLVGKQARVTDRIDNDQGTGAAVVNGQEWTARALEEHQVYEPGTMVTIQRIQGVKLIVTKIQLQHKDDSNENITI